MSSLHLSNLTYLSIFISISTSTNWILSRKQIIETLYLFFNVISFFCFNITLKPSSTSRFLDLKSKSFGPFNV